MSDIEKRLGKAHSAAVDEVRQLVSDLKGLEVKAGDLRVDFEKLSTVKLSEREPMRKVSEALDLLSKDLNGHHQQVNQVIAVLEFVKRKLNDETISANALHEFQKAVEEERKFMSSDQVISDINATCSDLLAVLKAEFAAELKTNQDLDALSNAIAGAQVKVEKL